MWYKSKDIKLNKIINIDEINGYILPHAGTKYTGRILSHTLQFKPTKYIDKILILYYPSSEKENIIENNKKYYHEFYVIMKTMKKVLSLWGLRNTIKIEGFNIRDETKKPKYNKTVLLIASVDFSHYLNFKDAIKLENCAALSIMHKYYDLKCTKVVDDIKTIKLMYNLLPKNNQLQWIGRTMSPGKKGVGYLSFLIRKKPNINLNKPDGIFVTSYDKKMNSRECLGEWYYKKKWNKKTEQNLVNKVLRLSKTTSRLTSGNYINIPLKFYTITYLYNEKNKKFIRGWHGIKSSAFYLPNVMLEHTFDNGKWINNSHNEWLSGYKFDMRQTLNMLGKKSGSGLNEKYVLYSNKVIHFSIKNN